MEKLIAWVEIPTTDFDRAVKFYNSVLNLNMEKLDYGEEKMACFPNDEGAVVYAPGYNPGTDGVLVSFDVKENLDKTIESVKANGGSIVKPKTKIEAEGRGFFAVFIDSEGNKVGMYGDK